jgi:thymidylate kinase
MQGLAKGIPAMTPDQGRLIAIDAIDGAGKDTMAAALVEELARLHGEKHVLDLDEKILRGKTAVFPHGDHEFFDSIRAIKVSEPTFGGIGLAIREEIMKKKAYDAEETAWAYALDRHVLYERTVLPFLRSKPGRIVIQARGLMSTLTYQPLEAEMAGKKMSVEELLSYPGNQVELSRRPDLIILLVCTPETAQKRLAARAGKVDGDKFSDLRFQAKVSMRYRSPEVIGVFERLGTKVVYIDAEKSAPEVVADCVEALRLVIPVT